MNESGMIAACISGNRVAQKALFEQYSKPMLVLCIRYIADRQEAEEVMLNGFYRCFTALSQFRNEEQYSLSAWIRKIMINECLAQLRKRKRLSFVPEELAGEVAVYDPVLEHMEATELLKLVHALPEGYRLVFNLYVVEGFSHKEIAAMLQIAEGTSKSQLNKARRLLQQNLQQKKQAL